ncbi:MAG: hypothetical protein CSYNP_03823 [Syntrophus sp. SKADARSKE-3]|nr:hypothetical protein [Syntrophus sp. SKADARSKE-3]
MCLSGLPCAMATESSFPKSSMGNASIYLQISRFANRSIVILRVQSLCYSIISMSVIFSFKRFFEMG